MRRTRTAVALASLLLAALFAHPVGAQSTGEKLKEAKARLAKIDREAAAATAEYEAARGRLILTQEQMGELKKRMRDSRRRVTALQGRLGKRAREFYQLGPSSTLELLLAADSFSEFSDRMVFLDQLAQEDADLVVRVSVLQEELRRRRSDLDTLAERQAETMETLEEKK
ncbi:MAG TPA: hypothetical protein VM638_04795, partial [Actinomycetota bacterium]|nr:hypothetical protein [Actinomycetota bacterium]